jgi:uncharacterized protein (TIGR03663 family)
MAADSAVRTEEPLGADHGRGPAAAAEQGQKSAWLSLSQRILDRFLHPDVELIIYSLILIAAIATRFWDLGSRPLHHDESLHAFFSWRYYAGLGYIHDPMMHGPFLFHLNALMYLLFGASDFVARVAPAAFGVAMVMLPVFLRKELGRWGAIAAAVLFLVSPTFLYYSRFIRNDIYCAVWAMIMLIAVVRYADRPRTKYLITGAAAVSLLFATKEISYITIFIFVTFFALVLLWQASHWAFGAVMGYGLSGLLIIAAVPKIMNLGPLPAIPVDDPSAANIMDYIGLLLTHPLSLILLALTIAAVFITGVLLFDRRARLRTMSITLPADAGGGWNPVRTMADLLRNPLALTAAILVAGGIFLVLYTSLFSNMAGIGTGLVGALGYWLAQHSVQRGHQPWFYYLLMIPLYEPLTLGIALFGGIGTVGYLIYRKIRGLATKVSAGVLRPAPVALFLWYWFLLSTIIYSWAGEKMPWLILHMVEPLTLIAALYIGRIVQNWFERRRNVVEDADGLDHRLTGLIGVLVLTGAVVVVGIWLLLTLNASALRGAIGWQPIVFAAVAMVVAAGAALLLLPKRAVVQGLAAGIIVLGLAFHIHSAWNYSYVNGATPVEMGIYVQTSPDVTKVVDIMERMATETGGDNQLAVVYDNTVSWPMEWYLRDFKAKEFLPNGPDAPPSAAIVLVGAEKQATVSQYMSNYVEQRYVLRWWFPEDMYRRFATDTQDENASVVQSAADQLGKVLSTISTMGDPVERAKLWRYYYLRQPYDPLGSTDFYVYIRKDLAPYWYALENSTPDSP